MFCGVADRECVVTNVGNAEEGVNQILVSPDEAYILTLSRSSLVIFSNHPTFLRPVARWSRSKGLSLKHAVWMGNYILVLTEDHMHLCVFEIQGVDGSPYLSASENMPEETRRPRLLNRSNTARQALLYPDAGQHASSPSNASTIREASSSHSSSLTFQWEALPNEELHSYTCLPRALVFPRRVSALSLHLFPLISYFGELPLQLVLQTTMAFPLRLNPAILSADAEGFVYFSLEASPVISLTKILGEEKGVKAFANLADELSVRPPPEADFGGNACSPNRRNSISKSTIDLRVSDKRCRWSSAEDIRKENKDDTAETTQITWLHSVEVGILPENSSLYSRERSLTDLFRNKSTHIIMGKERVHETCSIQQMLVTKKYNLAFVLFTNGIAVAIRFDTLEKTRRDAPIARTMNALHTEIAGLALIPSGVVALHRDGSLRKWECQT